MRNGWENKRLGDVCEFEKELGEWKGLPYVGLEHIESNTGKFLGDTSPHAVKSTTFRFTSEHVLYGRLRPYLNKVLLPDFEGHCSSEIFPIKTINGLDKRYLFHWLRSDEVVSKINATWTGARMPRANMNQVLDFEIPVPPIEEQRRIVAILDEAFAAIDKAKANTEKNIQNARELFDSYLNNIFSNPAPNWEVKELKYLCEKITKGSSPKWQGIQYVNEPGILFVTSENVGNGEMFFEKRKFVENRFNNLEKRSILRKGDVLTNIVGASIGRTAVFDQDEAANINQAVCVLRCSPEKLLNTYLAHLLNSPFFLSILSDGESNMARSNLSLGFFSELRIPVPRVATQLEITKRISEIRARISEIENNYRQRLNKLDETRKAVLQKAFSGKL